MQFLANRGYAVFQPNFRGSTGYGNKLRLAGFREWGGKMQNDITDGVKYLIAKGSNTTSQIATEALGVRRAWALGQVYPGVPVWGLSQESKYEDMACVVFPGNVGGDDALTQVVNTLRSS